jgi:hypothetical protein
MKREEFSFSMHVQHYFYTSLLDNDSTIPYYVIHIHGKESIAHKKRNFFSHPLELNLGFSSAALSRGVLFE